MLLSSGLFLLLLSVAASTSSSSSCPVSCHCGEQGEYVNCVGDGVLRLPDGGLPPDAVRLELRNFKAGTLSATDLVGMLELRYLKIEQCGVEALDNGTFSSTPRLERLDLSQNALCRLEAEFLVDLPHLRHLDVSSNDIESVEGAFVELEGLVQLDLRDNRLWRLTSRTFSGLSRVQYLNLDANNISSIEVGAFQYMANLARLVLSNNPLTSLSRLDFFGSRLQFIDASRAGLDRVPQSLAKFVRDLRLSRNRLNRIGAGDLDSYPYLGMLVLDDNCLADIENDALGRLEYLSRLWLNGNCLRRVPPNLPPSLLVLYMEGNQLSGLPPYSFRGLSRLEQLFLQRNRIRDVQACAFCDLSSLRGLDLRGNRIEALRKGAFANLTQLQTLDLSQNDLARLDAGCFDGMPTLSTLQLSRVHGAAALADEATFDPLRSLRSFEAYDSAALVSNILNSTRTLHGLRNLHELNLMYNGVSRLRADFPSFFPSLRVIKLSGNAWHCDAAARWLAHWIKQSSVRFDSSYDIRCASPPSLQLKSLVMLREDDFDDVSSNNHSSISPKGPNSDGEINTTKRGAPSASTVVVYLNNAPQQPLPTTSETVPQTRDFSGTRTRDKCVDTKCFDHQPNPTEAVSSDAAATVAPATVTLVLSSDVTAFARVGGGSVDEEGSRLDGPIEDRLAGMAELLVAGCCLLGLVALAACRLRRPFEPAAQRRRSSISYRPHKDEVSIVTLAEHNNKLYYIMENDSQQLQELLPADNGQLY